MENLVAGENISSFYFKKKVFITGHTGFKGSWLMATLGSFGAHIKGYALEPEQKGGLFDFLEPLSAGNNIISDIRDRHKLERELLSFQPDVIFHLAAQPLVRRSYKMPADTFDINVTGTANLLEAATKLDRKCAIVVITTDKVYQNKEQDILYNENDVLGGFDPYSASKACAELVVDSFRKSFFNPSHYPQHQKSLSTVRAGNVIGGGDWSTDRLLPDIINSLVNNEPVLVRNPDAVRPWQHVLEAITGYLLLAMKMHNDPVNFSQAFNFGPERNDHLPVKQIVEKAVEYWGSGSWKDVSDKTQPHEANLLKLDISKAQKALNWKPRLHAEQAIKWTIDWYKQKDEQKAAYTFRQIEEYFVA
ncbi:MAG: CDP-glucose 4,6-dehydratase [Chitinophagaceae bacterium]|nr:CDP-glucose 4,6-dehydratase [Chitinophagaceae bacterium]